MIISWDDEFGGFKFPDLDRLFEQGTIDYKEGKLDDAEKKFLEILKCNDQIVDVNYNLGILYRDKKQYDLSIKYFRKAIELNSKDAAIYCELSTALYYNGDKEEAKSNLEKTIEIDPYYALGYANLGVWYLKQEPPSISHNEFIDSLEKAKQYFEKALKLDPKCSTAEDGLRQTNAKLNIFKI